MKTAIILAAGVGSRLQPLTETMPKCCVSVAGKPLILRIVDQLRQAQPGMHIYIAAGYMADEIRRVVAPYGDDVTIVENTEYAVTNNMESCRMVFDTRTEKGPVLIINADCIYGDSAVAKMVAASGNSIGVDSSEYFEENMKVKLRDGLIREISKALPEADDTHTSIDFYSFEPAQARALHDIMTGYFAQGDRNQWTEVAIGDLVARADVEVRRVDINGGKWVEIDNLEDLERAQTLWAK